jgi:carbon storage regulator
VLVLSRRVGESIMIGQDVTVTVLEVRSDLVRLGIKAPRDVDVHREEVFLELQRANRAAASPSSAAVETLAEDLSEVPKVRSRARQTPPAGAAGSHPEPA